MTSYPFDIFQAYLKRSSASEPLVEDVASPRLKMIIVIPAFNESEIQICLDSLNRCSPVKADIEVLLVINNSVDAAPEVKLQNQNNVSVLSKYSFSNPSLHFRMMYLSDLPVKHSGVGVARKAGMDEALHRFVKADQKDGIIVCLDADCTVSANYFNSILKHFSDNPEHEAVSLNFEHKLKGETSGFCQLYELHLRYYIEAQRFLELPFAYQTVGSSMAVRALAYAAEGGMPKKKAGEDFYFLHKFIRKGVCGELNTSTVFPSCRTSDRVPFGTGRAISAAQSGVPLKTYTLESFLVLKQFIDRLPEFYVNETLDLTDEVFRINIDLGNFLKANEFESKWSEIKKNTTSQSQFYNRFYRWFDAFLLMKYLHFMRDHGFSDVDIIIAASRLKKLLTKTTADTNLQSLLGWYREKSLKGKEY